MVSNCTETAEGVSRASAPQHQPHGNPPLSQKYVPPAGTTGHSVRFCMQKLTALYLLQELSLQQLCSELVPAEPMTSRP
eukprot:3678164-Rhodomonas_salina.3